MEAVVFIRSVLSRRFKTGAEYRPADYPAPICNQFIVTWARHPMPDALPRACADQAAPPSACPQPAE
ncbi:MAG TPA: hypothetical protein PLQ35_02995 [bacterium]|nr:hypothetical protein [bacterium]HQL61239.1 hypothetical protein [bacterium]